MARQILGEKKTRKLKERFKLPIVQVLVRGGTDHRMDLCLENGMVIGLYKDGTMKESTLGWDQQSGVRLAPQLEKPEDMLKLIREL